MYGPIPQYPPWYGYFWDYRRPAPRTVYQTWDPVYYGDLPPPWVAFPLPRLPAITISIPLPRIGCDLIPVTFETEILTIGTWTDTITQPPESQVITVYADAGLREASTDWGPIETIYEVFTYTTTVTVDIVSATTQCSIGFS